MSNIKDIEITADAPWTWASDLPDSEAALFAGIFFNEVIGVTLEQERIGYVPNEHGGQTAMVRITITGEEAMGWPLLDRLATALASVGKVRAARARDIEDHGRWEPLKTDYVVEPTV